MIETTNQINIPEKTTFNLYATFKFPAASGGFSWIPGLGWDPAPPTVRMGYNRDIRNKQSIGYLVGGIPTPLKTLVANQ